MKRVQKRTFKPKNKPIDSDPWTLVSYVAVAHALLVPSAAMTPVRVQYPFPCENRRDERFWQQHQQQQHHRAPRGITLVLNVGSSLVITKGGFVSRNESII
jgi:hypothetical protein